MEANAFIFMHGAAAWREHCQSTVQRPLVADPQPVIGTVLTGGTGTAVDVHDKEPEHLTKSCPTQQEVDESLVTAWSQEYGGDTPSYICGAKRRRYDGTLKVDNLGRPTEQLTQLGAARSR
jgi:hypothetical protein